MSLSVGTERHGQTSSATASNSGGLELKSQTEYRKWFSSVPASKYLNMPSGEMCATSSTPFSTRPELMNPH